MRSAKSAVKKECEGGPGGLSSEEMLWSLHGSGVDAFSFLFKKNILAVITLEKNFNRRCTRGHQHQVVMFSGCAEFHPVAV